MRIRGRSAPSLAVISTSARMPGHSQHRSFELIGSEGAVVIQPIEPGTRMRVSLREARGRRIFPAAPQQSLLLLKATGTLAHGGGKRLEVGSEDYQTLLRWIEEGAPPPPAAGVERKLLVSAPAPRLLALPNVVMLPHMGSATYEGRLAMGEKVIANIRMWADGHRPPDQVLEGWV